MSRASEWAERFKASASERPHGFTTIPTDRLLRKVSARVDDRGRAEITINEGATHVLDGDIFVDLCRWGIATFGEVKP